MTWAEAIRDIVIAIVAAVFGLGFFTDTLEECISRWRGRWPPGDSENNVDI